MKRIPPGFATWIAIALASCAPTDRNLTLDELVAAHTLARGGRNALDAVKNVECELEILELGFTPAITLTALYRVDRRGRMRIDVSQGGKVVFTEAFDGARGWQQAGADALAEYAKPQAEASLRHGPQLPVNLLSLHDLSSRGHHLELLGRETFDGIALHRVRITLDDAFATDYYLDPETMLIARSRDVSALHPDIDSKERPTETQWSDYRTVAGTKRSFRSRTIDLTSGKEIQTVTIRALRVNAAIDPDIYSKP
jgi:hypothetical protein